MITWQEFSRAVGTIRATIMLRRSKGEYIATLTLIGGQGVDVKFTHVDPHIAGLDASELEIAAQGSRNRERAEAAAMLADLYKFAASINDDGNPWMLEVGPLASIDSGSLHIGHGDVSIVEHYFDVDFADVYAALAGSSQPKRKRRA